MVLFLALNITLSVLLAFNENLLDHEITLEILVFVLNLTEKVKSVFLLSTMCIFSESNGTKS